MTLNEARWGVDLRLLGNLDAQNDRERGSDLFVVRRPASDQLDLETIAGLENLKQALLLRFLTPVGELALLGHSGYGSRLSELIGEPNIERTHNRAKMFVLQALAEEPRVARVISVDVRQNASDRTRMDVNVRLSPIDADIQLNLVFPFFLEPEGTP